MLKDKQKRFVSEYIKSGGNAKKAAVLAGYSKKTARSIGSENLTKPDIAKAVEKAQKRIAEKAEWTALDILRNLQEIAQLARERGNLTAEIKCNELYGKQIGMFIDRVKVDDESDITIRWINHIEKPRTESTQSVDAPGAGNDLQRSEPV